MLNAPSVTYPVGRSFWALAFVVLVWCAGAAVTLALLAHVDWPGIRRGALAALLLACGLASGWAWWRTPSGELRWDGNDWSWRGAPVDIERVALDLQAMLLLRWRAAGARRGWLLLERARGPQRWGDLRRAVYSRRQAQTAPPSPADAAPT